MLCFNKYVQRYVHIHIRMYTHIHTQTTGTAEAETRAETEVAAAVATKHRKTVKRKRCDTGDACNKVSLLNMQQQQPPP